MHENHYSDIISTTIETNLGPIEIATDYIPPRTGYIHYPDYHRIFNQKHPVFFIGDINARSKQLGHSNENPTGKQLNTLLNSIAIHDGPHFPTYISYKCKTSPDIILKNKAAFHNTYSENGPITPSDHIPIIYHISTQPIQAKISPRLNFRKARWNHYKEHLSQHPIIDNENINCENIEKLAKEWTSQITIASSKFIPTTSFRTIPHPKIPNTVRVIQEHHDNLLDEINRLGPNYERRQALTKLRQTLREEYETLKEEMWNELVEKTDKERNGKDFWTSIKRMIGKTTAHEIKYLKNDDGREIHEDREKESIFRKYWSKVFTISDEENQNFDKETEDMVEDFLIERNHKFIPLDRTNYYELQQETNLITNKETKSIIASFKQKAPGEDRLTKYHLQNLPNNMITNLTKILNASLAIGYFPKIWKISIMIFIAKPNKSPYHHTNYRPISLLNLPAKVLEKAINNRLITFIEGNNKHNPRQHGFRKNRGTDTATALLYETIAASLANKFKVNIVLRDISKAFDKVWHNGLRFKMLINNFPRYQLRIISDYLRNRQAKVKINSFTGQPFSITAGVPQGGCLSPTLFNIYTADLPPPTANHEQIIYADDVTQIIAQKGTENMISKATITEIAKVNAFEKMWKIQTNKTKFQIIPIGRQKCNPITIDNTNYHPQKSGTVLGTIVSKTGFHSHIRQRIKLAKLKLPLLFRFINLSQSNKRTLYFTKSKVY